MQYLLNLVGRVLEKGSHLIFDAGANTWKTRERIRGMKHHYLTLKRTKTGTYKWLIQSFWEEDSLKRFKQGKQKYMSVEKKAGGEYHFIFFSPGSSRTRSGRRRAGSNGRRRRVRSSLRSPGSTGQWRSTRRGRVG